MGMELITGYKGTAHVTSAQIGAENAGIYGSGRYVFDLDERFDYELISNNLIRIKNGYGINQGRTFGIATNDYEELEIDNGLAGVSRYDLVVARYTKSVETGIETVELAVIKGTSSASPVIPTYVTGNILNGAVQDDFVLYKILIADLAVVSVTKMFTVNSNLETKLSTTGGEMTGAIVVNQGITDFRVYKNILQYVTTTGFDKQIAFPFPTSDFNEIKIKFSFMADTEHWDLTVCALQNRTYVDSYNYSWNSYGTAKSSSNIKNLIDQVTLHRNSTTQQLSMVLGTSTSYRPITHMTIDEIWLNGTIVDDYINGFDVNDIVKGDFILTNPISATITIEDVVSDVASINNGLVWTLLGQVDGTASLTLPSTFKEIHAEVSYNLERIFIPFHLIRDTMPTNDSRWFFGGYYYDALNNALVSIKVTNRSTISIGDFTIKRNATTYSAGTLNVRYR